MYFTTIFFGLNGWKKMGNTVFNLKARSVCFKTSIHITSIWNGTGLEQNYTRVICCCCQIGNFLCRPLLFNPRQNNLPPFGGFVVTSDCGPSLEIPKYTVTETVVRTRAVATTHKTHLQRISNFVACASTLAVIMTPSSSSLWALAVGWWLSTSTSLGVVMVRDLSSQVTAEIESTEPMILANCIECISSLCLRLCC